MNKEQAIKELNEIRELVEEDLKYKDYEASVILDQIDLKALIIVLDLLEKQQKEIEKKDKIINEMGEQNAIQELINNDYTSNDKIKAAIEKLKIIADNGANAVRFAMTHDDKVERIQKQKDISAMIDFLQSLLEKE